MLSSGWIRSVSLLHERPEHWPEKSCVGVDLKWITTSDCFFDSRLPVWNRNGTPPQRQLSIKSFIATKVSVVESGATFFSSRYPGTYCPSISHPVY